MEKQTTEDYKLLTSSETVVEVPYGTVKEAKKLVFDAHPLSGVGAIEHASDFIRGVLHNLNSEGLGYNSALDLLVLRLAAEKADKDSLKTAFDKVRIEYFEKAA